jgi:mono/diheme cytochrome c family protein
MKHGARIYGLITFWIWVLISISQSFASRVADTSTAASSERGAVTFKKSCSVCHSVRPSETKVGPSLYGILREGSGHSEQAVRQAIAAGKGTMPAFKEKLEPQQMNDLIEYLKTR